MAAISTGGGCRPSAHPGRMAATKLREHRDRALGRADRDVAAAGELDPVAPPAQLALREHRAQHDLHLEHREARAEAAAPAAAERDPGVGARWLVEEARGAEGVR